MGAMGSYVSRRTEDSSSDSSVEEYESDSTEMDDKMEHIAADAAKTTTSLTEAQTLFCCSFQITETQVEIIEKYLKTYEKVSLTYLLFEDPHVAFQHMLMLMSDNNFNNLMEWIKCKLSLGERWQEKFVEALTIIQNYEILKKLGYSKKDMYERFLPFNKSCTIFVNPLRKCLYRMCEDFTKRDTQEFLTYVKNDLKDMPDFNTNKEIYLEKYLLYFEMEKYIDCKNVLNPNIGNIIKICKYMGKDNLKDELEKFLLPKPIIGKKSFSSSDSDDEQFVLEEFDKTPSCWPENKLEKRKLKKMQPTVPSVAPTNSGNENYNIDPKNPGVLIIINNEHFYSDFRKDFQEFLPSSQQLEQREGTKEDKRVLRETFERFRFRIIEFNNLTHQEILTSIQDQVKSVRAESSIFIAILSHGSEGAVFGSNSIPINVQDIQEKMCSSTLAGKPKILILQCCQGSEVLNLRKNNDLATDGPSSCNLSIPKMADLLVFWATVPGYSAIRHKKSGTWFIQALCKILQEKPNSHFLDLCVLVQNEVMEKRWEDKVMVPRVDSTFSKFLYLPDLKENKLVI